MTAPEPPARGSSPTADRPRLRLEPEYVDPDVVVLLDAHGEPRGTAPRRTVHDDQTPLHRAFSVHLYDEQGRVLLTRRALSKTTWPGVWTNSCCGHPRPGETDEEAIARRVGEELGVVVEHVTPALPQFRYRARDASGIVENEVCPVYTAGIPAGQTLAVDPDEVMEWAWHDPGDVEQAVRATPTVFSPWLVHQVAQGALAAPGAGPRLSSGADSATPTAHATLVAVDATLADQLTGLADRWQGFAGESTVDVLGEDLPQWLGRLLASGGKRIRSTATHWGFVAGGGQLDGRRHRVAVRCAAATELLHQFALLHDDVMDGSDVRRGIPAAHREAEQWHVEAGPTTGDAAVFGRNLAILVGDLALTEAGRVAAGLPAEVAGLWHDMCTELVLGQRADLTGAAAGRRDLEHAYRTARAKSGSYTITRPLVMGARAAGATPQVELVLQRWGELVGEAFALRDDLLGVWGDPALTGKPSGDDLASGKATVLLALGRQRVTGPDAALLDRLGTPQLRPGDVARAQDLLQDLGVRSEVEDMVQQRISAATDAVAEASIPRAGIDGLADLAAAIAWRTA